METKMNSSTWGIRNAKPDKLANLMAIGVGGTRGWSEAELGSVFSHQMSAPVCVNLGSLGASLSGKLRNLIDAENLILKSFRDLFQHPAPPLELLVIVKEFAKLNRDRPESLLPGDVSTVLYYLSLATALVRCKARISSLKENELKWGFEWALSLTWIDQASRQTFKVALEQITGHLAS
jgi:hypothetical protein